MRAPWMQTNPVDQSIKSFLRIRPADKFSSMSNESNYLGILNDTDVLMVPPQNPKQRMSSEYKFTRVFDETATQSSLFEETCLPLLTPILRQDNYKALVFSHGVTKSGKTHSTLGSSGQAGIIPRTLKVLFDSIAKSAQDINTPTHYRPFRVHDVEINIDERKDSETIEFIRALDNNLATWIQKLALDPLEFNAGDLLVEDRSSKNPQVSLPEGMNYFIWISCAEISSERIYDLLAAPSTSPIRSTNSNDPKRPQLFLTTDNATQQKYIQDLREVNVRTLEEAMMVLQAGYRQRQLYTALTNKPSPKSHCIVTVKVLKTPQFGESALKDAAKGKTSISRLSFVDLAGSELSRTAISSTSHGVKDTGNGDTSLVVLGHCLKVLRANHTTNSKNPQEVPFRQSKLTQLFQGSLQASPAHSQVRLIININPYRSKFDEAARTLEFAATPTESSRTRIMDTHRVSKALLNNVKRLSTNPTSASHQQPAIIQTVDGSSEQHDAEDTVMLSQGQKETSDMGLDDGKSWVHPIEIGSKETAIGENEEPQLAGQGNATTVSGSKHCMSVECLKSIANMQEEFDRHREAFTTQDKARYQEFNALNDQIAENVRKMEERETRHQSQDKEIRELKAALIKSDADRVARETLHVTFEQELKSLRDQLAENERTRKVQEEKILSRDVQVQELKDAMTEAIANRDSQQTIQSLHLNIKSLTVRLLESAKKLEGLEERVRSRDEETRHLEVELADADAHRISQQALHELAMQSLEEEIQRLGTELERTAIERRENDEATSAKFQVLEGELVSQTQALADSLNTNHNLVKSQGLMDQEVARLRDELVASDKKCRTISERLESGDRDHSIIVLVRDLEKAEETRLALERELAKANETLSAWEAWLADSPAMKLARVAGRASIPEPETVAANINLASDDSLISSSPMQSATVATGVLATIQDAGDQATEQAVLEEDFVEHIDETMSSQDEHQDDLQDEPQDDWQIANEVAEKVATQDRTEAAAIEQIKPLYIEHGNKVTDLIPDVKTEPRPAASAVASHPDFVNLIEIESDSEDDYHATFKQRRISFQLTRVQHLAESSAKSSTQPLPDASEPGIKSMDSKASVKMLSSTRSQSLPGRQEMPSAPASRSPPARVTRSRYSLPNNPTVSARTRSAALQPPIKKTRLATDTKLSLIFKDSDVEEEEEDSEEEESEGFPLLQVSKAPTMHPEEPVDSGADTTVVQTEGSSSEAPDVITAWESSPLPAPATLQESNSVANQRDPVDEDFVLPLAAGLDTSEKDRQGDQSPDFTPRDDMQPDLSQELGAEDDMPEYLVQNVGLDDYLQADGDEMPQDDSDDGDEERLVRRTHGRRMSLSCTIDDHIGTPAAEMSPVRPLYPNLKSMTPSPRRTSPSPPSIPSKDGVAENKWSSPTSAPSEARMEEPEAAMQSPDRSHSSSPRTSIGVLLKAKQDSLSTKEGYSDQRPYVDDDLDFDGEKYHSLYVRDVDGDDEEEVEEEDDGDKDLNGAISEYDSAQESLDAEESIEFRFEMGGKVDTDDKENGDPKSNRIKLESLWGKAGMGEMKSTDEEDMEDKENGDPNSNRKKLESLRGGNRKKLESLWGEAGKGEMKSTDDEDTRGKDDEEDEGYEVMKKGALTVDGMKPKSKKRKLRPTKTVFVEEMNEFVDMHDQPANTPKQLHRKLKNKNKNKMY
ncbi:hypothetical protein BGZ96_010486 [Linnemannia gamsii]|uniref:Kinesin motor domain-containing protein n=1 Tax=Linnemannia gamsii TaxID=64522 RepID=A0ABQ7KBU9_9FUNG|nr:hypothetical protein BGZ96_010486 [Linnemannia gamsii]